MRNRSTIVIRLFAALLVVYAMLRLAFLLIYFPGETWTFLQVLKLFYHGFRMDIAALFYINIPFLLYYFFVDVFFQYQWRKKILVMVFCLINLPFLALNFIDLVYFKYNHRRSTVDLLDVFKDSSTAFSSFFKEYWYVLFVFILVCVSLVKKSDRIIRKTGNRNSNLPAYIVSSLIFLAAVAFIARGFAKRPIQPSTPLLRFEARYQPLVNNSTFNFIYSLVKKHSSLEEKHYFTQQQLDSLLNIHQQYRQDSPFVKRNVVIFVLESFSKELFPGGSQQSSMPFFDSLLQRSTVCNNAFASAYESNKGLPAVLGSLPDVMDEPVYLSNYNNISFKGLGHILKEEGYNTSFFMGAEYDHFGFAKLCRMTGIDNYYSRDTYGKHNDQYDGNWGIYDEYFFKYFGKTMSQKQQPFLGVLFNLSSHPPYKMPPAIEGHVRVKGQRDYQDAATYVDYCYRALFNDIKNQPWFNNTVFVFVADHGFRYELSSDQLIKELRIPLFIYDPRQPQYHPINVVANQLDVVPSVLDKLHYAKPFNSFGTSIFRKTNGFSISRLGHTYEIVDSASFTAYDEVNDRPVFIYNYREDPLLRANLLPGKQPEAAIKAMKIKALLQKMNSCLIQNRLE